MPKKNIPCPECAGTGVMTITVITSGQSKEEKVPITCVTCRGSKVITPSQAKALAAERDAWCRCETAGEAIFVGDGESTLCSKHHYLCSKCRKILQVG